MQMYHFLFGYKSFFFLTLEIKKILCTFATLNNRVMVIANPIYDIVFKRLMENKRIARFFVETIIGEQVEDIAVVPQEWK